MNKKFENIITPHIYTNQMLTVVSVDSSSRRRQPCVAASLCFGRVPGYSPARATDASPAQLARAPTQTPVSKNQLCVKLVNIVLLVKLLIHVFWYVRKNSSSTFKTLSHSMTMAPLKHETFTGARMDERFFTCAVFLLVSFLSLTSSSCNSPMAAKSGTPFSSVKA